MTFLVDLLAATLRNATPLVYGTVAATLLTAAAVACLLPARRAMRVPPAAALRED